jgi:hypothetical protein
MRCSTRLRSCHRDLRCANCRGCRHSHESGSRRPCRRRSRHRHCRRVRHQRWSRIHPRPTYRAIRVTPRDRPSYALARINAELLLSYPRWPRITRFSRKQGRQSRIHCYRCCDAAACDRAAGNHRHQSKRQANRRNRAVEARFAASLSSRRHHPSHHYPSQCEEGQNVGMSAAAGLSYTRTRCRRHTRGAVGVPACALAIRGQVRPTGPNGYRNGGSRCPGRNRRRIEHAAGQHGHARARKTHPRAKSSTPHRSC